MIREETMFDGRIHHWSDQGVMIRQIETGVLYEDAVDSLPYTYEETDEPLPAYDLMPEDALEILLGGTT